MNNLALKRWLPSIIWIIFILTLSSMPGADFSSSNTENFAIRKVLHLIEYCILFLTFYRATKRISYSILLSIAIAASDEFRQTFIPGRTGKIEDIMIDSSAVVVTGFVIWKYFQNLPKTLKAWLLE